LSKRYPEFDQVHVRRHEAGAVGPSSSPPAKKSKYTTTQEPVKHPNQMSNKDKTNNQPQPSNNRRLYIKQPRTLLSAQPEVSGIMRRQRHQQG